MRNISDLKAPLVPYPWVRTLTLHAFRPAGSLVCRRRRPRTVLPRPPCVLVPLPPSALHVRAAPSIHPSLQLATRRISFSGRPLLVDYQTCRRANPSSHPRPATQAAPAFG